MKLQWTVKGLSDLTRLYDFLVSVNPAAAVNAVQSLTRAAGQLLINPRIGEKLEQYEPREIRRVIVGHHEIRYEIREAVIYILRLWHTREDR